MLNKLSLHWIFIIAWAGLSLPASAATTATSPKPKLAATQAQAAPISGVKFQPTNRRDPFLDLILLNKNARLNEEEAPRGQAPPGIAGMYIAQVKLQGISIREGSQLAVFRGSDNRAYFLQEGDKFFDGFVKKINADSVLLIRETKLRSGKESSQEITKWLRTP